MLHQKIIETRKQKGFTQEELAESAGVTVRTIQRIETGESIPRAYTLKAIAAGLGIPFEELLQQEKQESIVRATNVVTGTAEDTHHFLQLLTLSCFAFIVIPFVHFLVPGYLLRKRGGLDIHSMRFARKLLRAQVYWVVLFNLSMLLTLSWNLWIKHSNTELPLISYLLPLFLFYFANAVLILVFLNRLKRLDPISA